MLESGKFAKVNDTELQQEIALEEFLERVKHTGLSLRDMHIILDALPIPISWATIPTGKIQFMNRAFKETFGYDESYFATVDAWIEQSYPKMEQQLLAREYWNRLRKADSTGISKVEPLELDVVSANGGIVTVNQRGILLHDIGVGIATFEDVSERKRVEETLRRIAFEDPLTSLGNRRRLSAKWNSIATSYENDVRPMIALILIDLDEFKPINDLLGHDAGDEALLLIANRLRACVRSDDTVFRLGGDEFAILVENMGSPYQAEQVCRRVERALKRPIQLGGTRTVLGASVGVSLYPDDATGLAQLIKHADEALYRIKRASKGGWAWFSPPEATRYPKSSPQRNVHARERPRNNRPNKSSWQHR